MIPLNQVYFAVNYNNVIPSKPHTICLSTYPLGNEHAAGNSAAVGGSAMVPPETIIINHFCLNYHTLRTSSQQEQMLKVNHTCLHRRPLQQVCHRGQDPVAILCVRNHSLTSAARVSAMASSAHSKGLFMKNFDSTPTPTACRCLSGHFFQGICACYCLNLCWFSFQFL